MSAATKENAPEPRTPVENHDLFGSPASASILAADGDRPQLLLSPPPEEELRYMRRTNNEPSSASKPLLNSVRSNQQPAEHHSSKRKRTAIGGKRSPTDSPQGVHQQAQLLQQSTLTPNPRLRKQVRHAGSSPSPSASTRAGDAPLLARGGIPNAGEGALRAHGDSLMMTPTRKGKRRGNAKVLVPQSPHAANPSADYIPPSHLMVSSIGVAVRRRSVTPIPPYEPPKERYTPPREIMGTPLAERKPARRAAAKKKRGQGKGDKSLQQLRIKTEPPEIDLTSPLPPASPSEDPILLVGSPPAVRAQRPSAPPRNVTNSASLVDFEMDLDFPENGGCPATSVNPSPLRSESSIPPVFDFSGIDNGAIADDGWSDSSSVDNFGSIVNDIGLIGGSGVADDGWSDSDSSEGEGVSMGEGDFTGKFLAYKVPTKMDPPTSAARERMEEWGRPISPHPKRLLLGEFAKESIKEEEDEDEINRREKRGEYEEKEEDGPKDDEERRRGHADKSSRRLTLSELEAIKFGPIKQSSAHKDGGVLGNSHDGDEQHTSVEQKDSMEQQHNSTRQQEDPLEQQEESMKAEASQRNIFLYEDAAVLNGHSEPEVDDVQTSVEGPSDESILVDEEANDNPFVNNASRSSKETRDAAEHSSHDVSNDASVSAAYDQEHVSFDEHIEIDEELLPFKQMRVAGHGKDKMRFSADRDAPGPPDGGLSGIETEIVATDEPESDSDEGASDSSVVKIMSDDPMAAARAAAILKMHDYDMVARKLKRRRTAAGRVSKSYDSPQKGQTWRRRTVAGLSAEEHLTANIALPELLDKAEQELRSSPARSRSGSVALSSFGTPTKDLHRQLQFSHEHIVASGPREWTKADWKMLDSCFTDERYDLAEGEGLGAGCIADVDDVVLENVVERFTGLMGGSEIVESHGPSWTTEKLLSRLKALCKRQRAGDGAPPTPEVSRRFSTPSRHSTLSPSPSMVVPNFTPTTERIRLFQTTDYLDRNPSLPPPSSEPFFKVPFAPSTMPARRSHLSREVTSSVLETPPSKGALGLFGFATPIRQDQDDGSDDDVAQEVETMLTPNTARLRAQAKPASAVKRSLNYISSWLKPDMFKSKQDERKGTHLPGLPVPPSDVLARPRGPVETPAPKPPPKVIPPKEQVTLQQAPPPQPTKISRASIPRVELQHIPTPPPKPVPPKTIPRRSSSSSVKDLVKEFEQMERVKAVPPRVAELRKMASVESMRARKKPAWKP